MSEKKAILDWDDAEKEPDPNGEKDFETAAPVPGACSIDNPDCEACQ